MGHPKALLQFHKADPSRMTVRHKQCRERKLMRFSELVKLLEQRGFELMKEKGSIRYYAKPGWDKLIRVDYHGSKEVPTGTCHAILKAAGIRR